jgi:hypothetical protein
LGQGSQRAIDELGDFSLFGGEFLSGGATIRGIEGHVFSHSYLLYGLDKGFDFTPEPVFKESNPVAEYPNRWLPDLFAFGQTDEPDVQFSLSIAWFRAIVSAEALCWNRREKPGYVMEEFVWCHCGTSLCLQTSQLLT